MSEKIKEPWIIIIIKSCAACFTFVLTSHIFSAFKLINIDNYSLSLLISLVFGFFAFKASSLLINIINKQSSSSQKASFLLLCLPFAFFAMFSFLYVIVFISGAQLYDKGNSANPSTSSQKDIEKGSMDIVTSSQPTDGMTEGDMNESFLKNYEAYILGRLRYHINQAKEYGLKTISPEKITTISSYIEIDNKKLAVIRTTSPIDASVSVLGIVNNEIKRVSCAHGAQEDIPITYGDCGNKVKEVFNLQ